MHTDCYEGKVPVSNYQNPLEGKKDAKECVDACRDTLGCIAATFIKDKNQCDLKSSDDAVSWCPKNGYVAGYIGD